MAKDLKRGDRVKWKSHGGEARGQVVRKVSSRTRIKNHEVAATSDEPQFIVETDEGKRAAHRPGALTRES